MKSLYAYFGLLDLHDVDSPGHSLYQIGLIDSIRETWGFDTHKFDFYSYYPNEVIKSASRKPYPGDSKLGQLFNQYYQELISEDLSEDISTVFKNIENREYSRLYLKARFRNLSTLSKKWKDAREFEKIIDVAVSSGYTKDQIVILDTDLSLPEKFYSQYSEIVTIQIPSIDFPGISNSFLKECAALHLAGHQEQKDHNSIVFYGNIDTSNYKEGNSKSAILGEILNHSVNLAKLGALDLSVITKGQDLVTFPHDSVNCITRQNREEIWNALSIKLMMLNITKEKYNEAKFIPARIYEAMIFGMIPISYKFEFLCPAFSFNNLEDFEEILKYLGECDHSDLTKAYQHFIESYFKYINSWNFQKNN
jgi:hypothetical protein